MTIASYWKDGYTTELRYFEGQGYAVYHEGGGIEGSEIFIATYNEAVKRFLWHVGYPQWTAIGEQAAKEARIAWLNKHQDLASIGARRFDDN